MCAGCRRPSSGQAIGRPFPGSGRCLLGLNCPSICLINPTRTARAKSQHVAVQASDGARCNFFSGTEPIPRTCQWSSPRSIPHRSLRTDSVIALGFHHLKVAVPFRPPWSGCNARPTFAVKNRVPLLMPSARARRSAASWLITKRRPGSRRACVTWGRLEAHDGRRKAKTDAGTFPACLPTLPHVQAVALPLTLEQRIIVTVTWPLPPATLR